MADSSSIPPPPRARRKRIILEANIGRVITRPYIPSPESRIHNIINRVLKLKEKEVTKLLETVLLNFTHRHRYFRETLQKGYEGIASYIPENKKLSKLRKLLIGAYFTAEYSVEAAALFNPSIVMIPSEETDPEDSCRFIMSFRVVGEGHISSIEFRSGIINSHNDIYLDPLSDYVRTPKISPNLSYNKEIFQLKLQDLGTTDKATDWLLNQLPDEFTFNELQERISSHINGTHIRERDKTEVMDLAIWLARSNYEISFQEDHLISERVIFPVSETESGGIEDARFVRFVEDDGSVVYYATYTAYNGHTILPQIIKTKDFITFRCSTLNGKKAQGKGMALFPRKINGMYYMLSRQDGENNYVMFSDNVHFWNNSKLIQSPKFPHEFIQIGNGGSPIETPEGWLVITHGVGPMRTYTLGIELLDLEDPTIVLSRIDKPILKPNDHDRDGYVPNVVYTCGAMLFNDELIIPYASADQRCGIATLNMTKLMARLMYKKTLKENKSK